MIPDFMAEPFWPIERALFWWANKDCDRLASFNPACPWDEQVDIEAPGALAALTQALVSSRILAWGRYDDARDHERILSLTWHDAVLEHDWFHMPKGHGSPKYKGLILVNRHGRNLRLPRRSPSGYLLEGGAFGDCWHHILVDREELIEASSRKKRIQHRGRISNPIWGPIEEAISKDLVDHGLPQKGDGRQAALVKMALEMASDASEVPDNAPSRTSAQNHVNKMIRKRKAELGIDD